MALISFPTTLKVRAVTWGQTRRDTRYDSSFGSQSVEIAAPVWSVSIVAPPMKDADAGSWKAFLMKLRGTTNQVDMWDMMRPYPLGTMRGTMTLNAGITAGDVTVSIIAATQAAKTLLAGDMIGVGTGTSQQVVMVVADATANGSGVISVTVEPPFRDAHSIAAAVTWDKPKALFRLTQSSTKWGYSSGALVSGFTLDLSEDWRA